MNKKNRFGLNEFNSSVGKWLLTLIVLYPMLAASTAHAQASSLCYGVAEGAREFFHADQSTGESGLIGTFATGIINVEAIAFGFDPVTGDVVLYAADADEFGYIDLVTGAYTLIGTIDTTADGLTFNDVDSIAYDVSTGLMWGVERNTTGSIGNSEEYIFQIDLTTGAYVPGTAVAVDNLVTTGGTLQDVDDLAIDPVTGIFYATMNNVGADYLAIIDPTTGVSTAVGTGLTITDMEGLAFNPDGELFGSTGTNSELYAIDKVTGVATLLGDLIEPSGNTFYDVEALACLIEADIQIEKTVYLGHDNGAMCSGSELVLGENGDPVTYCFEVTNTGDTYLDTITVTDSTLTPAIDRTDMTLLSGTEPLAPGDSLLFYYDSTIMGDLVNMAETSGNPTDNMGADLPGVEDPTDEDTAEVDEILTGSWSGSVSEDTTGDGLGDTPIGGVTIELFTDPNGDGDPADGVSVGTTTTDPTTGDYIFENLTPGDYVAVETQPADLDDVTEMDGGADGDANEAVSSTDNTISGTVASGEEDASNDFVEITPNSIGSLIWEDLNGDGLQDANEPPIAGALVELLLADGSPAIDVEGLPVTAIITGATGLYMFDNLPNDDYIVQVTPPSGLVTSSSQSAADDDVENDSNIATESTSGVYQSGVITLLTGTELDETGTLRGDSQDDATNRSELNSNMTVDFGFMPLASIGNYVWLDFDMDGVQDANEDGIAGVTVTLTPPADVDLGNGIGTPITTITGSNGEYLFSDLPPADGYVVTVDPATIPAGLEQTYDEGVVPGSLGTLDNSSEPISLSPNEEHLTADFGYAPPAGSLGDTVWIDSNNNGMQDPGESGVEGVTVTLTPGPSVDAGNGPGVPVTVITDANGKYLFTELPLNQTYQVEVTDTAGALDGYSHEPLGDPDVRDGFTTVPDETTYVTLTTSDPVNLDADFGYLPPEDQNNSVGDTIWIDANADGSIDPDELPAVGVTVSLIDATTGEQVAATTTDANGEYLFTGIPDGLYTVVVTDANNVLAGLDPTYDDDGIALTPNESTVDLDSAGTSDTPVNDVDQDFGYVDPNATGELGTIGDTIFFDANNSGTPDEGEGLEGVVVELFDDNGVLIGSTTTDENGNYLFTGLELDMTYTVTVDTLTLPNEGDGWTNSVDPDGGFDSTSEVTLTVAKPTDLDQDFGYIGGMNSLSGTVWPDTDGDGTQLETGVFAGVTVEVRDQDGDVIAAVVTDANGTYNVDNLPDGLYTVVVTDVENILSGFEHTDSPNGLADTSDQTSKDDTGYVVDLDSSGVIDEPVADATGDFGYEPVITTPITLGSFSATSVTGGVQIEWTTQTEVSNLGFNLYASINGEWAQVNESAILGQGDSIGIQSYSVILAVQASVFAISDIDAAGKEAVHGPFMLDQNYGDVGERQMIDWGAERDELETQEAIREQERLEQQRIRNEERRLRRLSQPTGMNDVNTSVNEEYAMQLNTLSPLKTSSWLTNVAATMVAVLVPSAHAVDLNAEDIINLNTTFAGIYEVSHEDLITYDESLDLSGIAINEFALMNQGEPVEIQVIGSTEDANVFGPGASVRFIASQVDTLYSDTNVYTLRLDNEAALVRMTEDPLLIPSGASATAYLAKASYAPQSAYSYSSPDETDPWYAKRMIAIGDATSETMQLNLDNVAPGGNSGSTKAKLKVNLWGVSSLPGSTNDHRVKVRMNNTEVVNDSFDGTTEKAFNVELDSVRTGTNNVTLSLPLDAGYTYDAVNVDEIEVSYPRQFVAIEDRLDFPSTFRKFTLSGFSASNEFVVMREDDDGVSLQSNVNAACRSTCSLQFGGTGQLAHYYVASASALLEPVLDALPLEQDITSDQAEYLIISHPNFIGASSLQNLVTELGSQMNSVKVVDVEAIYAQYGHHVFDPAAIQAYIKDSVENRGTEYVLLVGGDVYDYRQFENEDATSFIPSIYAATGNSITFAPVDAKYVDVNDDNVPDLPIGRLPVRTVAQLDSLLSKRTDYVARTYNGKILLVADKYDVSQQYDFAADAAEVSSDFLGAFDTTKVYVDDYLDNGQSVAQARSALVSAINEGQSLTGFFGHSSTNQWAFNGLFTGNDAAGLSNYGKPTVVTQWGCWNAYYVSPNEDSMGHRFMMEGDQGAVAVMGATTLTNANSERKLARLVLERIANGERLGDAITNAKQEYAIENPNDLDVLLGWTLLGLPELVVN